VHTEAAAAAAAVDMAEKEENHFHHVVLSQIHSSKPSIYTASFISENLSSEFSLAHTHTHTQRQ